MLETIRDVLREYVTDPNKVKKYFVNLADYAKKNGYNTIYAGHLHAEHKVFINGVNVNVVGSFIDGYIDKFKYNGYDYYIIADPHIGSEYAKKTKTKSKLVKLLKNLKAREKVILLGDVFELWTQEPDKIIKRNKDLISLINELAEKDKLYYIKGNHDADIESYVKIKTYDELKLGKTLFVHGHNQDPVFTGNWLVRMWNKFWLKYGDNLWFINRLLKFY